jgi:hypothetical protein
MAPEYSMSASQLNSATRVQAALSLKVGLMGLLGGSVHTKPLAHPISKNARRPSIFMWANPKQSARKIAGVRGALVLRILGSRDIAKIDQAVVGSNSIDVVDLAHRPRGVMIKPSQPVLQVRGAIYANPSVSTRRRSTGSNSSRQVFSWLPSPSKAPILWVVVEKFAQTLRGKIGLSHDAVLSLIGQRPRSVCALSGLRHFNAGVAA